MIINFTAIWYREVLTRVEQGSSILDIGIGTGTALLRNVELLRERQISVVGVDYDADYVAKCESGIQDAHVEQRVQVRFQSVYDCAERASNGEKFDAIYFSGSFMILPDKLAALKRVESLMKPGGKLYFTQTFELEKNSWLEIIKPKLSYWTSIDFGGVTYEDDFNRVLDEAGFTILEKVVIDDGKAVAGLRESVLVVASS